VRSVHFSNDLKAYSLSEYVVVPAARFVANSGSLFITFALSPRKTTCVVQLSANEPITAVSPAS